MKHNVPIQSLIDHIKTATDVDPWAKEMAEELLKEQTEREKRICKAICDFIHGSCSTDTYEDKDYVCSCIQQFFIKEGW